MFIRIFHTEKKEKDGMPIGQKKMKLPTPEMIPEGQTIQEFMKLHKEWQKPTLEETYKEKGAKNWTGYELGLWYVNETLNMYRKNKRDGFLTEKEALNCYAEVLTQGSKTNDLADLVFFGNGICQFLQKAWLRLLGVAQQALKSCALIGGIIERCADHERLQDIGATSIFREIQPDKANKDSTALSEDLFKVAEYVKAHGIQGFLGDNPVYSEAFIEEQRESITRCSRFIGSSNFLMREMSAAYGIEDITLIMDSSMIKDEVKKINETLKYLRLTMQSQDYTDRRLKRIFRRVEWSEKPSFKRGYNLTNEILTGNAFNKSESFALENIDYD